MAIKITAPTKLDRYKRLIINRYFDNSGGLNTTLVNSLLADNESPDLKNCNTDDKGAIVKRKGYTKVNSVTIGANPIDNIFKFYKTDGSEKLLCSSVSKIYKDVSGTWTEIDDLTTLGNVTFDTAYISGVEYAIWTNGSDALRKYDGTTVSDFITTPKGTLLANHTSRAWVSGSTTYPNRIFYSDIADPITFGANSFIDVNPGDGDKILAIEPLLDNLVIYKRKSLWVLYGDDSDNFTLKRMPFEGGCISGKTVVAGNNNHYFLGNEGVYIFDGAIVRIISEKIASKIRDIGQPENAVACYYRNQYWLAYTSSGGTYNDRILMHDTLWRSWWYYEGINARCLFVAKGGNDEETLYIGDPVNGFVYEGDTGNNDATAAISFYYKTKAHDMGIPERKKRFRKAYIEIDTTTANSSLLFGYAKDLADSFTSTSISTQGSGDLWDTAVWDVDTWDDTSLIVNKSSVSGQSYFVQFKFSNNNADEPQKVYGYTIYWRPRGPK